MSATESLFTADLPRSVATERALIGALLLSGAFSSDGLEGSFLTDRELGEIHGTMEDLWASGCPVDIVTVGERHPDKLPLLTKLVSDAPATSNIPAYVADLKSTLERRRLAILASRLGKAAFVKGAPYDVIASVREELLELQSKAAADYITAKELLELTWDGDAELVDEFIVSAGINLKVGEVGSGKSFEELDRHMALACPANSQMLGGRRPNKTGPTLYLGIDNNIRQIQKRVRELARGRGMEVPNGFHLCMETLDIGQAEDAQRLANMIEETGAIYVTVDLLIKYVGDANLNYAHEVNPALTNLRRMANDLDTSFGVVHRFNREGGNMASVEIDGAADTILRLAVKKSGGVEHRILTQTKHRDRRLAEKLSFAIVPGESGGLVLAYGDAPAQDKSRAEELAKEMYEIAKASPGEHFSRKELADQLELQTDNSNFKAGCKELLNYSGIESSMAGNAWEYWHQVPSNQIPLLPGEGEDD